MNFPETPIIWCVPRQHHAFAEAEAARRSIEKLAFPEANWDGYGALPVSKEAKANALRALTRLETTAPFPAVSPNPNGTLSFEWETEFGIGQLEIGRTRYSFLIKPNIGRAILHDGPASQIQGFLGAFVDELLYPKPPRTALSST